MAKIHISVDLKDLENMLNLDDPEVALKFSSNVIQQFSKRYLKDVVKDESFALIEHSFRTEVFEAVKQIFEEEVGKKEHGNWGNIILHQNITEQVKTNAKQAIGSVMEEQIELTVTTAVEKLAPTIESKLELMFERNINRKISEEVERRMQLAMKG